MKCGAMPSYADDATIIFPGKSRQVNQVKIESHLNTMKNFLISNKLAMNEEKTTIMEVMVPQKRQGSGVAPLSL